MGRERAQHGGVGARLEIHNSARNSHVAGALGG
jgi:hypothetical protein